jgi:hypothetical protein
LKIGLNHVLTLLNSFQIYKLLLDFATSFDGTFLPFIACLASLLGDDATNIIISLMCIINLAFMCVTQGQDPAPNYTPKRLRSNMTSLVSVFQNRITQSLNPFLNGISGLITNLSTRKHVKFRSRSRTNCQRGHHGNSARYTAKRKLLPQKNYRIYQRADLPQYKSNPTANTHPNKPTTFIGRRLAQLWCMVAINQIAAPSTQHTDRVSTHLHQTDSDSFLIAIDNCCSRCITNSLDDFVSPPAISTTSV